MELKDVISTEMLVELMTIAIQAVIVIAVFFLKKYVTPILTNMNDKILKQLGEANYQLVRSFVQDLVANAEKKYKGSIIQMGETKKQEVIGVIQRKFPDFDEDILDAILENAVQELQRQTAMESLYNPQYITENLPKG